MINPGMNLISRLTLNSTRVALFPLKSLTLNGAWRSIQCSLEVRDGGIREISAAELMMKVTISSFLSLPLRKYFVPLFSDAMQTVGTTSSATGSDADDASARRR